MPGVGAFSAAFGQVKKSQKGSQDSTRVVWKNKMESETKPGLICGLVLLLLYSRPSALWQHVCQAQGGEPPAASQGPT